MLQGQASLLQLWSLHSCHDLKLLDLPLDADVVFTQISHHPQGCFSQERAVVTHLQSAIQSTTVKPVDSPFQICCSGSTRCPVRVL